MDHALLLLWVKSVDSIMVCHALRRSSEMALTSSSPSVMGVSAKGSSSYFSRYSSISSMDSGVSEHSVYCTIGPKVLSLAADTISLITFALTTRSFKPNIVCYKSFSKYFPNVWVVHISVF